MVYNEKLVVSIKSNGKILREYKDIVYLPFGSEYSILIKNLNSNRAVVSVSVDGEDAIDGSRLVIDPNSTHELEGFLINDTVRNKFKFIEKTDKISSYRGDKIDDGIVRVEYQFEAPKRYPYVYPEVVYSSSPIKRASSVVDVQYGVGVNCCSSTFSKSINDEGITVKGSPTHVEYACTTVGDLDPVKHTIVLKLKGSTGKATVNKLITTQTKLICPTCGTSNRSRHKYCSDCGTCLI